MYFPIEILSKMFKNLVVYNMFRYYIILQKYLVIATFLVSEYKNLTANVPGGIYSDLMDNGIIGNIFFGSNDTETRWVAKKNWVYQTVFTGLSYHSNICTRLCILIAFFEYT